MSRTPKYLFAIAVTTTLVFGYTNCGKLTSLKSAGTADQSSKSNGQNGFTPPAPSTDEILSFSKIEASSLKLGDEFKTNIQIVPNTKYSGDVTFEIDRSGLASVMGQQDILIAVEPKVVKLNGQMQNIALTVETATSSPSFMGKMIRIKAIAKEPGFKDVILDVPLSVKPELDIKMFGGTIPADRWNRPAAMNFSKHDKPLILNFINYDMTGAHVLHGAGNIPHGVAMLKAPASGGPGGVYKVTVDSTATQGQYWYHDIENSTFARTMMFNVGNTQSRFVQSVGLKTEMTSQSNSMAPHKPTHCSEM